MKKLTVGAGRQPVPAGWEITLSFEIWSCAKDHASSEVFGRARVSLVTFSKCQPDQKSCTSDLPFMMVPLALRS